MAVAVEVARGLDVPAGTRVEGPDRADERGVPSISHIAAVPSSCCQRMSDLLSPLKSPVSLMCQAGPGLNGPTAPTNVVLAPSISHIAAVPLSCCQMMSDLLSPSKSPVALTCQVGPGLTPTAPTNVALVPSISHAAGVPLPLCHRMSELLSPFKLLTGCCDDGCCDGGAISGTVPAGDESRMTFKLSPVRTPSSCAMVVKLEPWSAPS